MRVEEWRSRVVEQFGALDSDPNARDLVLTIPKLRHLFIKSLKLLREFLGRDHGRVWVGLGPSQRILPVLALAHPDGLVNLLAFSAEIVPDILAVCQCFEHGEDLEFLALPGLEVECLWILNVSEVRQWVKLYIKEMDISYV